MSLGLSQSQTLEEFHKMWKWMANEMTRTKRVLNPDSYFEMNDIPKDKRPKSSCYICDYMGKDSGGPQCLYSKTCLINWYIDPETKYKYGCLLSTDSIWYKYWMGVYNNNYKEAAKYAKIMSTL